MNLSNAGIDFIKQWEGLRLRPYDDGYGNLTIGYGHLIKAGERFGAITEGQAEQILVNDLAYFMNQVNSLVRVPLTQSQFDALVSLAFNWGQFAQSSHLQRLNAGDYAGTARRIGEHPVTSGGVFSRGLANRRRAEKAMFLSQGLPGSDPGEDPGEDPQWPIPDPSAAPPPRTDSNTSLLLLGGAALLAVVLTD